MTDEARLRFLTSIAKQLPVDRVAELHLFPAMRQGGVESGVAVIALEREQPVTIDVDGGFVPPSDVAEAAPMESHQATVIHDQLADESAYLEDEVQADPSAAPPDDTGNDVVPSEANDPVSSQKRPSRFTIYSAHYRHTLKGPERGKWEVFITDEADAPLITVDAVVRGVQRRSGEVDEIYRMDGSEFRALLPKAVA